MQPTGDVPVGHREAAAMAAHFESQRMHMLHQEQLIASQTARIAELELKSRTASTAALAATSSPLAIAGAAMQTPQHAAQPQQRQAHHIMPQLSAPAQQMQQPHGALSPLAPQQHSPQHYAPSPQQRYAPQQQSYGGQRQIVQQQYVPQQYVQSPSAAPQQLHFQSQPVQYQPQPQPQFYGAAPSPRQLSPLASQQPQQYTMLPFAVPQRQQASQPQPRSQTPAANFAAVDERDWIEINGIGETAYWFNRRTRERARSPPLKLMSARAAAPLIQTERDLRDASLQRFHAAQAAAAVGGDAPMEGAPAPATAAPAFGPAGWDPSAAASPRRALAPLGGSPRRSALAATAPATTFGASGNAGPAALTRRGGDGWDEWTQHAPHLQPAMPVRTRHNSPRRPTPQRLDDSGPLPQPTPTPRTAMLNPPTAAAIANSPLRRGAPWGVRPQIPAQTRTVPAVAPVAETYEAVGPPRLNSQPRPRVSVSHVQRTKSIASPVRHGRQRVAALSTPRRYLQVSTARDKGFGGVKRREPQTLSGSAMAEMVEHKAHSEGPKPTLGTGSAAASARGESPHYLAKRPNISVGLSRVIGGGGVVADAVGSDQTITLSDGSKHPITPMMAKLDQQSRGAPAPSYLSKRPALSGGLLGVITGGDACAADAAEARATAQAGGDANANRTPVPSSSPHYMHKRPAIGIGLTNVIKGSHFALGYHGVETEKVKAIQGTPLRSQLAALDTDSPLTPDNGQLPAYMTKRPQLGGGLKLLLSGGEDRGTDPLAEAGGAKNRRVRFLTEGKSPEKVQMADGGVHPVTPGAATGGARKGLLKKTPLSAAKQAKVDRLKHFHVTPSGNFEMEGVGKITTHGMEMAGDVEGKLQRARSMSSDMSDEMSADDWKAREPNLFVPIRGKMGQGAGGAVVAAIHAPTLHAFALKRVRCDRKSEMQQSFAEIHAAIEMSMDQAGDQKNGIVNFLPEFNFHDPRTMTMSIVLEFMNGGSLQNLIERGDSTQLSEEQLASITHAVVVGLAFMHRKGQMHRDIKPANILMSSCSGVKIADFGIVKETGASEFQAMAAQTNVGTQLYMSPERIDSSRQHDAGYSANVDLWSLGVVLVELALGKNPVLARAPKGRISPLHLFAIVGDEDLWLKKGQAYEVAVGHPSDGATVMKTFSDELCDFTEILLRRDADTRAGSSDALAHAFLQKRYVSPPAPTFASRRPLYYLLTPLPPLPRTNQFLGAIRAGCLRSRRWSTI